MSAFRKSGRRQDTQTGCLFIAPALLLIAVSNIFPAFFTAYVSLFKWRIRRGAFWGLATAASCSAIRHGDL